MNPRRHIYEKILHLCGMALILGIETSGEVCSVALFSESICLASDQRTESFQHAAVLTVLIEEMLVNNNVEVGQLDAVALSAGPGSYTGLRIGTSVAKGLCYALDIPLIAVSSLELMASGFLANQTFPQNSLICPLIDARRMEVFTAIYTTELEVVQEAGPMILDEQSYLEILNQQEVHFLGNGVEKTRDMVRHSNAHFHDTIGLGAQHLSALAWHKWKAKEFADVAYFEPWYLKAFYMAPKTKKA